MISAKYNTPPPQKKKNKQTNKQTKSKQGKTKQTNKQTKAKTKKHVGFRFS